MRYVLIQVPMKVIQDIADGTETSILFLKGEGIKELVRWMGLELWKYKKYFKGENLVKT